MNHNSNPLKQNGLTRFDLAKEAAFNLIDTLTEYDNATIINFNEENDFWKAPVDHSNPSVKKTYNCVAGAPESDNDEPLEINNTQYQRKTCQPTLEPMHADNIQQMKKDLLGSKIDDIKPIDQ